jgi:uncharacterized membrane protein YfcA
LAESITRRHLLRMTWLALLLLGVTGGVLTTVSGLGGGIVVVLIVSLFVDPRSSLAITAPALLAGNTHRLWLFRKSVDRKIALRFIAGAAPGAFIGSVLAITLPEVVLAWVLLGVSLLAAARGIGWLKWTPPASAIAPAGFAAGTVAATSGAGILVSPVLLATGIKGEAFIATSSAVAMAIHIARIAGYGIGGMFTLERLGWSAALAVGLLVGNVLGLCARDWLGERGTTIATYATLGVAVVLALTGIV